MKNVIHMFDKLANPLKAAILEKRIKLLKAEAKHKPQKVKKHEDKLLRLELELRQLKDKYNSKVNR